MNENQVITEAALEAATVALNQMRSDPTRVVEYLLSENVARAALEAAAPFMLERAYDEGFDHGKDRYYTEPTNPYRTTK